MKTGVFIVNVARGGIIEESALATALDGGKVSGVALDVFEQEPPRPTIVSQAPRVVVTPHSVDRRRARSAALPPLCRVDRPCAQQG
jgi:phosphoglycerate dehydrogenase-like enzyme